MTTEPLAFETLTGLELRRLKTALGRPLEKAAQDGDLEVAYGLEWIRQTRTDPAVKFEDVLALPIGDVIDHLDEIDTEDPPGAGSGKP